MILPRKRLPDENLISTRLHCRNVHCSSHACFALRSLCNNLGCLRHRLPSHGRSQLAGLSLPVTFFRSFLRVCLVCEKQVNSRLRCRHQSFNHLGNASIQHQLFFMPSLLCALVSIGLRKTEDAGKGKRGRAYKINIAIHDDFYTIRRRWRENRGWSLRGRFIM